MFLSLERVIIAFRKAFVMKGLWLNLQKPENRDPGSYKNRKTGTQDPSGTLAGPLEKPENWNPEL